MEYSSVATFSRDITSLEKWVDSHRVSSSPSSSSSATPSPSPSYGEDPVGVSEGDVAYIEESPITTTDYLYELSFIGGFALFEAFQQDFLKEVAQFNLEVLPDNFKINLKQYLDSERGDPRNEYRINCLVEHYTQLGVASDKWFKVISNTYNIKSFASGWRNKYKALKSVRNAYTHRSGVLKTDELQVLQNYFNDLPEINDNQIKPHSEYFYSKMSGLFKKAISGLSF